MSDSDLCERALANFEYLLDYWGLDYKKISEVEYDIIAKWRNDRDYGGCRFNTFKARGADFAGGGQLSRHIDTELKVLGFNLDASDLVGYDGTNQLQMGFDIIGLAQRVYSLGSKQQAATQLELNLKEIAKLRELNSPLMDGAKRRAEELERYYQRMQRMANDIWSSARFHEFKGSPAEVYLHSRGILFKEDNMRFHPKILKEKVYHPALILKVAKSPEGPLEAIHRIFLTPKGRKVKNKPKLVLSRIKGNAIWFGTPGAELHLAEGPESAMYLRQLGKPFVASCISATNMHNLTLPPYVKRLILVPDQDQAGADAASRAIATYDIKIDCYPYIPGIKDINDLHRG